MTIFTQDDAEGLVQRITGSKHINVYGYYDKTFNKEIWREFYVQDASVLDYLLFSWKVRNTTIARLGDYEEDKVFLDTFLTNLRAGIWNDKMQEIFTFQIRLQ
jgi:hypothetical protein